MWSFNCLHRHLDLNIFSFFSDNDAPHDGSLTYVLVVGLVICVVIVVFVVIPVIISGKVVTEFRL